MHTQMDQPEALEVGDQVTDGNVLGTVRQVSKDGTRVRVRHPSEGRLRGGEVVSQWYYASLWRRQGRRR